MAEEVESAIPDRIVDLTIRNYRVLRDVRFTDLTPMTALLGPNGRKASRMTGSGSSARSAVTYRVWNMWFRSGWVTGAIL